jgi:ataxia telangiectasia mutated family protein
MDKREIRRQEKEMYEFLNLSVENYLSTLQSTETKWDMCVFRILSLWFAHTSQDSGINTRIANFIKRIPSRKFLVVMYQLSARILTVNSGEEEFQDVLTRVLEKMCTDHPYHCLYQIIALTNTERLRQKSGFKEPPNSSTLLARLKQKRPSIVQRLEFMCNGYMSLAADPIPKTTKNKDKKIPIKMGNPLLRANDLQSIPPITMDLPVDDTLGYKDIPTIVRFDGTYWIPGGINAPKVISCHASNGQVYTQLVKGNGMLSAHCQINDIHRRFKTGRGSFKGL